MRREEYQSWEDGTSTALPFCTARLATTPSSTFNAGTPRNDDDSCPPGSSSRRTLFASYARTLHAAYAT